MTPADITALQAAMARMFAGLTNGTQKPSAETVEFWADVLAPWPMDVIRKAMSAHARIPSTGRTLPIPADIVAQIKAMTERDDRPGKDEAWAACLSARDEAETVVWSDEMRDAWAASQTLVYAGDMVGARMAFLDAYQRLVSASRSTGKPAKWSTSLGTDPERRAIAISAAVEAGKLPASELSALPPPRVAGLLELASAKGCPDGVKQALIGLRVAIKSKDKPETLARPFKRPAAPWEASK